MQPDRPSSYSLPTQPAAAPAKASGVASSVCTDSTIEVAQGQDVAVRMYGRKKTGQASPVVVHFHGGAFMSGDLDNGCTVVCEGANMPSTPEAIAVYQGAKLLYGPAKAANAGGVAVSGLEMSQNSYRLSWTFDEVDAKLKQIMEDIVANSLDAAKEYGREGDLMLGANAAGFVKVANTMVAQGIF